MIDLSAERLQLLKNKFKLQQTLAANGRWTDLAELYHKKPDAAGRWHKSRKIHLLLVQGDQMDEIYRICKFAMECIVHGKFALLENCSALTRVSESDIKRVLKEYDPDESPVMPPDAAFEETAYIVAYRDGSGYHIDINFWYPSGESDLTLQLDVRKRQGELSFIVDDIRVL